ncbi:hypothetical protein ACFTWH_09110 [Streptomyces sp. NPDC057011]|uniref:hypothetical protein n=1 Tax=unclassified Streptomyces TaxID=2593676 RepID=UPI00362C7F0B
MTDDDLLAVLQGVTRLAAAVDMGGGLYDAAGARKKKPRVPKKERRLGTTASTKDSDGLGAA